MLKKLVFIVLGNLCFAGGFEFLGYGARAVSLGYTYIAIATEPYAIFYNPGGLAQIKSLAFSSSYSKLYPFIADDNLYSVSLAGALSAFSIFNVGVGGYFLNSRNWNESQLLFGLARKFWFINLGIDVRFLRWSSSAPPGESPYSYFGVTFDGGLIINWKNFYGTSDLKIGFSARNINTPSIAKNGSKYANLPLELGFGVVYVSNAFNYIVGIGGVAVERELRLSVGMEIQILSRTVLDKKVSLFINGSLSGIVSNYRQSSLNAGFGINYGNLRIDYAYVYQIEIPDAGGNHKITIGYSFK